MTTFDFFVFQSSWKDLQETLDQAGESGFELKSLTAIGSTARCVMQRSSDGHRIADAALDHDGEPWTTT